MTAGRWWCASRTGESRCGVACSTARGSSQSCPCPTILSEVGSPYLGTGPSTTSSPRQSSARTVAVTPEQFLSTCPIHVRWTTGRFLKH